MILAALQTVPEWVNDNLFRWVTNNGFAVVAFVLLLVVVVTPLFVLLRTIVTSLGHRIDSAVFLFSGTLSTMSGRQEAASDEMVRALRENTAVQTEMLKLLAGVNKSQDITLRFIAENMAQVVAHREVVEPTVVRMSQESPDPDNPTPETGVLKSIEGVS